MRYILAYYVVMSAFAFGVYWVDKRRAVRGSWRVSERTLHTIELLGGWPGAWIAQRVFRHKWQKTAYVVVFWMIVAAHVLGWVLYLVTRHQVTAQVLLFQPDPRSNRLLL